MTVAAAAAPGRRSRPVGSGTERPQVGWPQERNAVVETEKWESQSGCWHQGWLPQSRQQRWLQPLAHANFGSPGAAAGAGNTRSGHSRGTSERVSLAFAGADTGATGAAAWGQRPGWCPRRGRLRAG